MNGRMSRIQPAAQWRPLDPRLVRKWTIFAPLLGAVMVFALTVLDPLGFESITKEQSAKIFYKIYASAYPAKQQDKIAVVVLDNQTLDEFSDSWPPSHLVHNRVLDAILFYRPAAVLVDMFFFHRKSEDDFADTVATIEKYEDKQVPLFLTVAGPGTGAHRIGLPEMGDKKFQDSFGDRFVSAEVEGEPGQSTFYPLHDDSGGYVPAALAVYRAICEGPAQLAGNYNAELAAIRWDVNCSNTIPSNWLLRSVGWFRLHVVERIAGWLSLSDGQRQAENHPAMDVVWGLNPARINCARVAMHSDVSGLACEDLGSTWIGRALELLWVTLIPPRHRDIDVIPIPYHAEVSTTDLLNGGNYDQLKKVLSGKLVIYSSQVAPRKDFVLSPVHGNIDGVFIHAMALDNLLTWGQGSVIRRAPEGWFYRAWTEFQPTVLMAFVAFLIFSHRRYLISPRSSVTDLETLRRRDERLLKWLSRTLYLLVVSVGLYEFFVLRVAPFNWLGLLIVVHIAHRIDKWFFKVVERAAEYAGWRSQDAAAVSFSRSSKAEAA